MKGCRICGNQNRISEFLGYLQSIKKYILNKRLSSKKGNMVVSELPVFYK